MVRTSLATAAQTESDSMDALLLKAVNEVKAVLARKPDGE